MYREHTHPVSTAVFQVTVGQPAVLLIFLTRGFSAKKYTGFFLFCIHYESWSGSVSLPFASALQHQ